MNENKKEIEEIINLIWHLCSRYKLSHELMAEEIFPEDIHQEIIDDLNIDIDNESAEEIGYQMYENIEQEIENIADKIKEIQNRSK